MKWRLALIVVAGLAACAPVEPRADVNLTPEGTTGSLAATSGRVTAGVGTNGEAFANADVVQTENTRVNVGTGGLGLSIGNGPVRIGARAPWQWLF